MEIAGSIVAKIGEYLVAPIGQQFGYLIYHNNYIKNFRDQFQRLSVERAELQLLVDVAKRNGEVIAPRVEWWIQEVDKINERVERLLEENVEENRMVWNGRFPDLKSRYSLCRKAKKKTLAIAKLVRDGKFERVSYPAPPLEIGLSLLSIEAFKGFESRKKLKKKVLEALKDDEINMIAICGMGGIGKTTMVEEVKERVKADNLFDEVVMAMVSQNQDLRNIQGQIADTLHLELKRESEAGRADELYSTLMKCNSVLVILDDVWDEPLDLKKVGIPYGSKYKRFKLLLTSRFKDACKKMKTQNTFPNQLVYEEEECNQMKTMTFPMELLSEEEAWNLFREMAGNFVDNPNLCSIAQEVAKECACLPIAIVTVGRALEDKSKVEWNDALQRLKMSIPKNIPGLDPTAYSRIGFSYNYLKSDEEKSCFLLCCLFPEDYDIPIEYLVRDGVGRRLFAKINNIAEARNRVHAMVENLKRSFLLLDSRKEECVKMHDIVRDVAISIADEQGFLVGCDDKMEEWPEKDTYENYAAISLVSRELKKHPDGLECPKLELLHLSCGEDTPQTFPTNFFKGMKELKVLSMRGMSFPFLPQSIQVLQNLRTLHLEYCELEDVSAIGKLGKLEMLSFLGSKIEELPREIGNLLHLKLLDLSHCSYLLRIPPGLLSSLSRLEELYMEGVFLEWGPLEGNREGSNEILAERIAFSHHLMALAINITYFKLFPKDLYFKNEMIKFQISIGGRVLRLSSWEQRWQTPCYLFKNTLELISADASDIVESPNLRLLLQKSEIVKFQYIKNLKNFKDVEYVIDATSNQNLHVAFPMLQSLELFSLPNLKEIYHGQFPERSFSGGQLACFGNLRSLKLLSCHCLKNVFSLSIARGLVQLQELDIRRCNHMEEILFKGGENEKAVDVIKFPKLRKIHLSDLPRLIGFCKPMDLVELVRPSNATNMQPSSNQEVGRMGTDELTKMIEIQHIGSFPESRSISPKFFSSKTILWPPNLEILDIWDADLLEVVFDLEGIKVDDDQQTITALAQLKTLEVQFVSKLMYVWKNVPPGIQGFQNLTSIEVYKCDSLRYLFPPSIAKLLVELQSIEIKECDAIKNIVQRDGEEEATDIIVFPKVSSFTLQKLPNLVSFCIEAYSFEWPSMKEISLHECPKLMTFGSNISSPRKQKKISEELDSRPQEPRLGSSSVHDSSGFLGRYLECVPGRRNYGPNNKSQRSSSVKKEGTLTKLKDPRACDIDNPSEICSLFPSHMIECLNNLELIYLHKCDSLEVIFKLEGLNDEQSHVAPVLDQLRKLDLDNLPKLMHIWKKGPEQIMGFKNLKLLEVKECDSLTYLFSPSIAKLLVMLEEIKVTNCEKMEEILSREREEGEEKDVLFNKVNSIVLIDLPNLKCFCHEANALEWPSLKKIGVIGCPTLRTFIPGNLKTPELEGVYKFKRRQWKGDLNATIEHIFKGKEPKVDHETQQQEKTETSDEDM